MSRGMPSRSNLVAGVAAQVRRWTVLGIVTTLLVAALIRAALRDHTSLLDTILTVAGVIGTLAYVTLTDPPAPRSTLTARELAMLVAVTQATWWHWERGATPRPFTCSASGTMATQQGLTAISHYNGVRVLCDLAALGADGLSGTIHATHWQTGGPISELADCSGSTRVPSAAGRSATIRLI